MRILPSQRIIFDGAKINDKKTKKSRSVMASSSTAVSCTDDDASSDMVPLSYVCDPREHTFVDQMIPAGLADVIRKQKKPPKTLLQISRDPNHPHQNKAVTQLLSSVYNWYTIGVILRHRAAAQNLKDFPSLQDTDLEQLSGDAYGSIKKDV